MKLLFDQNLAPRLVQVLRDLYPNSSHVREANLQAADDTLVWEHALAHGFAIVTKDDDFRQRSFLFGAPPKVIWIRLGNCTTAEVASVLRSRHRDILAFEADPAAALLLLARQRTA